MRNRQITNDFEVYPNPVDAEAHIAYPIEMDGVGMISVYDSSGRLVIEQSLNQKGVLTIATKTLDPGLYQIIFVIQGHRVGEKKMAVFHN
jgi:hypothetical protein